MSRPAIHPAWLKVVRERLAREKVPLCKPGHHSLRVSSLRGIASKELACTRCRFTVEVPLDAKEVRQAKAADRAREANTRSLHGIGWKYQREFYRYEEHRLTDKEFEEEKAFAASMGKGMRALFKPRRVRLIHRGLKWSGIELITRLERFARRNPGVVVLGCDDHHHASSVICLIPHRSRKTYWGSTLVIAPQLGIFPPTEIFLYPGHAEDIVRALGSTLDEGKRKLEEHGEDDFWFPDASIPKDFTAEGL